MLKYFKKPLALLTNYLLTKASRSEREAKRDPEKKVLKQIIAEKATVACDVIHGFLANVSVCAPCGCKAPQI